MMKHFQSIIKTVVVCTAGLFLFGCEGFTDDEDEGMVYQGDFRLSEEARNYIISDTVASTFKMIDNHNITDEFVNSPSVYSNKYLSSTKDFTGSYERFFLRSTSLMNGYRFQYQLYADQGSSRLEIDSNLSFFYDFNTKEISKYSPQIPELKFYDEMQVRGVTYHKIIEVDYAKYLDEVKNDVPIKIYYSTEKGLIKFIRKDGIFFERI